MTSESLRMDSAHVTSQWIEPKRVRISSWGKAMLMLETGDYLTLECEKLNYHRLNIETISGCLYSQ